MIKKTNETWKWVPNYEGHYKVSDLGRVESFKGKKPHILSPSRSRYLSVSLSKNDVRETLRVHTIVARAFLGHKPNSGRYTHVDHVNGDRYDNRLCNLEVISSRENSVRRASLFCKNRQSEYPGVSRNIYGVHKKKWKAGTCINGRKCVLGTFDTEKEAYDRYLEVVSLSERGLPWRHLLPKKKKPTSKHPGVYWNKNRSKWAAQIKVIGENVPLGIYGAEDDAIKAFDNARNMRKDVKSGQLSIDDFKTLVDKFKEKMYA